MRDVRLDYAAEIRGERKRDGRPGRTQAIRAESLARPRAAALAAEVERLEVEARRANDPLAEVWQLTAKEDA